MEVKFVGKHFICLYFSAYHCFIVQQGTREEKFINRNEKKLKLLVSISFVFALLLTTVSVVQQETGEEKFIKGMN